MRSPFQFGVSGEAGRKKKKNSCCFCVLERQWISSKRTMQWSWASERFRNTSGSKRGSGVMPTPDPQAKASVVRALTFPIVGEFPSVNSPDFTRKAVKRGRDAGSACAGISTRQRMRVSDARVSRQMSSHSLARPRAFLLEFPRFLSISSKYHGSGFSVSAENCRCLGVLSPLLSSIASLLPDWSN